MSVQKKFIVQPDFILSKFDGDEHYINAHQLIDLYGVNPAECVLLPHPKDFKNEIPEREMGKPGWPVTDYEFAKRQALAGLDIDSTITLRPLYDGHYREHLENLLNKQK